MSTIFSFTFLSSFFFFLSCSLFEDWGDLFQHSYFSSGAPRCSKKCRNRTFCLFLFAKCTICSVCLLPVDKYYSNHFPAHL